MLGGVLIKGVEIGLLSCFMAWSPFSVEVVRKVLTARLRTHGLTTVQRYCHLGFSENRTNIVP